MLVFAAFMASASRAQNSETELARRLSNDATRATAIASVLEGAKRDIPLLLLWTRKPPAHIETSGLYVGLAEVFGQLQTKEAIPFLIKNIGLQRWPSSPNTWMKTPEVIEARSPAVTALIRIGPDASRAIIRTGLQGMTPEDRLAAIFVVGRIKGVPESVGFLSSILGEANLERHWAEQGLKQVEVNPAPAK